jgi:peptide-methionine (S)-S-oxide reductase
MIAQTAPIPSDGTSFLGGRPTPIPTAEFHFVNGRRLAGPYPEGLERALFGLGCFWGAERLFWAVPGVYVTAAGYAGGVTPNPTYGEICTDRTGHAEVVQVIFDPTKIGYSQLLALFWNNHNPTQGLRQGADIGSQYRSVIFTTATEQDRLARLSRDAFQSRLHSAGYGAITTEIGAAPVFYFAEDYHQQYLAKNPDGYCGLKGTGVACP